MWHQLCTSNLVWLTRSQQRSAKGPSTFYHHIVLQHKELSVLLTTVCCVWKFTSTITKKSKQNKPRKIQNINTVNASYPAVTVNLKGNKLNSPEQLHYTFFQWYFWCCISTIPLVRDRGGGGAGIYFLGLQMARKWEITLTLTFVCIGLRGPCMLICVFFLTTS